MGLFNSMLPFVHLVLFLNALSTPIHASSDHQTVLGVEDALPIRAGLPVANSTRSFWFTDPNVLPSPKHGSEGPLTDDADICIIGSGITGTSTAYHLAKSFSEGGFVKDLNRPVKAVILEAREFCSGATGRNGGHITADLFFEFLRRQTSRSTDEALRAYRIEEYVVGEVKKLLAEQNKTDFTDFVSNGRLYLAYSEKELAGWKADFEAAKAAGVDVSAVEWFSKEETQEKFGAPYPSVVTPGNNIWPLKLVSVLFNLAQKIGSESQAFTVDLHTETPVTSISPIPQSRISSTVFPRRHSLSTPRGTVSCSYVVHATNGYTSHLLPHLAGPNGIIPKRAQIIATRASVTQDVMKKIAGVANDGLEYWFPRPLKGSEKYPLVIVGGGEEIEFELYKTDDSVLNEPVGKGLRRFMPSVYPERFDAAREPEMEWTGILSYTKSGDPFVGPVIDPAYPENPAHEGQFVSAGYSGHGMPRAYACAEAVSQMVVADIKKEKWELPDWLPTNYLTTKHSSA
ncbi:hypothetical protein QCA50_011177 [Cerrena zonata]|uniref:FAD dependent oxidoreductase domain-containing protein n=1 Tax=Cerrena zonata TaxID=2478898 RepID=A0AAW0G861_9APHY